MYSPIETLIPHRAPMRWINALTQCAETTASASVCFDAEHIAVAGGRVLESALVECVAQTVAAALGQRAQIKGESGPVSSGMLAAVSEFRILLRPPPDVELCVKIRELKSFGPWLKVEGTIWCAGSLVASGELTLHV